MHPSDSESDTFLLPPIKIYLLWCIFFINFFLNSKTFPQNVSQKTILKQNLKRTQQVISDCLIEYPNYFTKSFEQIFISNKYVFTLFTKFDNLFYLCFAFFSIVLLSSISCLIVFSLSSTSLYSVSVNSISLYSFNDLNFNFNTKKGKTKPNSTC